MNSKERIRCALELKEADRVPIGEFVIDPKVIARFGKGHEDVVDFALGEGLDLVGTMANFKTVETLADGSFIDEWGCTYKPSEDYVAHPIKGPIASQADLDKFEFPDPDAPHRLGGLEELIEKADGRVNINFHCRVAFMWSVFLMGMDGLLMAMALEPEFAHDLFSRMAEVNIAVIRRAVRAGADTISLGDDYCANKGPLMSPDMFRTFILPHLKHAVDTVHEEGAKCIKHCDGNIWPLLDMWLEAGVDAINPLEPVAGMDMGEVKQRCGDRVCLMGNIDCSELLCNQSVEEVDLAVKECIEAAGGGGGLIVSSSNSIHHGVKPENYSAMIKAVHKYGKYPIG